MRLSSFLIAGGLFAAGATAFPNYAAIARGAGDEADAAKLDAIARDRAAAERLILEHQRERRAGIFAERDHSKRATLDLPLGGGLVNGVLQKLTGQLAKIDIPTPQPFGLKKIPGDDPNHQFKAPGRTDVRGMCPTLNALANHGYISRNGVSSFAEVANACQIGFGLGYDVSTILSAFALFAGGDLISGKYSIGDQDDRVPNTIGLAPGLDSHGGFEIDTSIIRQDTHWGSNANFLYERRQQYVARSKKYNGQFNFDMHVEDVNIRYDNSRKYNPSFLAGVLWLFVSHVEQVFVFALLANGTGPDNVDYKNVAPFFLNETFPPDWYRRATPWTAPEFRYSVRDGLRLRSPAWCQLEEFTGPSQSAGEKGGVYSSSGSPVNGKYPGLGYIKPDGPS